MKEAKAVAKAVARDHWILDDDHSFFWETTREGKGTGVYIRRQDILGDGLAYGVIVKIHPLFDDEEETELAVYDACEGVRTCVDLPF